MGDERKLILNNNKEIDEDVSVGMTSKQQLMLFLSYDITDSTEQKIKHPESWPQIIDVLVNTKFQHMSYWKFNGDEILYKRNINSLEFVCGIIEQSYQHLEKLNAEMKKYVDDISVKATIWLALSENDAKNYKYNFSFKLEDELDFVGRNIDEGFRLTKCSSMHKMAIDPKIVYILLDAYEFLKTPSYRCASNHFYDSKKDCDVDVFRKRLHDTVYKLHLIGYVKCKGIWGNNPYPVYWYYDETKNAEIQYNEYLGDEHLWQKNIHRISDANDVMNEHRNLQEILVQMNVMEEIEEIYKLLVMQGKVQISAASKANLYYMVACVNPKTNKVLIARRSGKRKHLKKVWDFGNVKYQNINMKDTIVKEYKNTFGIDIELALDENRGGNLKPFGYCTIYRNCKPHNSILCHATICNPEGYNDDQLIEYINQHKSDLYDEVRFVDADDVADFKTLTLDDIRIDSEFAENNTNTEFADNTCIMYFQDSIRGVINEQ